MGVPRARQLKVVVIIILLTLFLYGCDDGLAIINIEPTGTPNRVIYIANIDTELDLNGLYVTVVTRDGFTMESPITSLVDISSHIYHDIDFAKPGVYEVVIDYPWIVWGEWFSRDREKSFSFSFFIQVVDKETLFE